MTAAWITDASKIGMASCAAAFKIADRRPILSRLVVKGEPVVRLLIDGAWITVSRSYVVADYASDGRAHYCGHLHSPSSNPIDVKPEPFCVILPPRDT